MDRNNQFTQLLKAHKNTIYTVCYMFSDNKEEVEDLFQEVSIRIWQGYDGFRGEASVGSWIWRIAMNTCLNWQKKSQHEHQALEMNIDLFAPDKEDLSQIRMLYDRIHQLGLFDRAIILLWLENMSYEEITQIIGISVKNVSVRLVRIRERLKNM